MGSSSLCAMLSLYGMVRQSWVSYKLLKSFGNPIAPAITPFQNQKVAEKNPAIEDMTNLLHFWTVFAFLTLYEYYLEMFVFWMPFYYTFKFCLLCYLIFPETKGSTVVFTNFVLPYLAGLQDLLNSTIIPLLTLFACRVEYLVILSNYRSLSDENLDSLIIHFDAIVEELSEARKRRVTAKIKEHCVKAQQAEQLQNVDPIAVLNSYEKAGTQVTKVTEHPTPVFDHITSFVSNAKDIVFRKIEVYKNTNAQNESKTSTSNVTILSSSMANLQNFEKTGSSNVEDGISSSEDSDSEDDETSSSSSDSDEVKSKLSPRRTKAQRQSYIEANIPSPGKYDQGFSTLKEFDDESPTAKAGASYMDSVIKMMKGVDGQETPKAQAIQSK